MDRINSVTCFSRITNDTNCVSNICSPLQQVSLATHEVYCTWDNQWQLLYCSLRTGLLQERGGEWAAYTPSIRQEHFSGREPGAGGDRKEDCHSKESENVSWERAIWTYFFSKGRKKLGPEESTSEAEDRAQGWSRLSNSRSRCTFATEILTG